VRTSLGSIGSGARAGGGRNGRWRRASRGAPSAPSIGRRRCSQMMHGRRGRFHRGTWELKATADRVGLELKVVAHGGGHGTSAGGVKRISGRGGSRFYRRAAQRQCVGGSGAAEAGADGQLASLTCV
jgi:hypothetical protein